MDQLHLELGVTELQPPLSAPPMFTPPRLRLEIELLERHDDPEAVVLTVKGTDGEGQLLALWSGMCRNGVEWGFALATASTMARWAWYEMHSPFED